MANYTDYMGLYKPNRNDDLELETTLAENFQTIDDLLGSALKKGSTIYSSLSARFSEIENLIENNTVYVNVKDFGAVGDGTTDNTNAFKAALNHIQNKGGGTLYIPNDNGNASYYIESAVPLISNLRVLSNGATLKKNGGASDYYIFTALSNGETGYGSSASNIIFDGVTFSGDFAGNRGASVTLIHSQNVLFKNCTFRECTIAGHPIDLGGCDSILIDNCVFLGQKETADREYTEAIQIDNAVAEGSGGIDASASYDGLASRNVTVQNCKFLPLTIKGVKYPAPNPLGSHSRVQHMWFTNIKFINNYVEDAVQITNTTSPYAVGWLHFYHVDGLEIIGNTFKLTENKRARVIGLLTLDTAILEGEYANPKPPKQAYVPQPPQNVKIKNNRFEGFKRPESDRIIFLQGRNYNSKYQFISNVEIHDNDFIECFNTGGGSYRNASSDLIHADYTQFLSVKGNTCINVRRLLYSNSSFNVTVANNKFKFAHWVPLSFSGGDDITIFNNDIVHHAGGFYFRNLRRISVFSNNLQLEKSNSKQDYNQVIAFNNCTRMSVYANDINGSGILDNGIYFYGGASEGKCFYNFVSGFTKPIAKGSTSGITIV